MQNPVEDLIIMGRVRFGKFGPDIVSCRYNADWPLELVTLMDEGEKRKNGRPDRKEAAVTADFGVHCAITTYGEGYFSARDERYRYIRYPGGTEELYDPQADPYEHENLAGNPALTPVKERLAKRLPGKWAKSLGGRLG